MFTAAMLTFSSRSRHTGAGMIFGASLVTISTFTQVGYFNTGLGRGFLAATMLIILTALVAAGASAIYIAPEARQLRANLGHPLVFGFCAAAIGYTVAYIPGDFKFFNGDEWVTGVGLLGSGVHGRFLFAGVVALVALVVPVVIAVLLAPGTGVRTGIVTGWLLITFASELQATLLVGQPGLRLAPAFFAVWLFWGLTAAMGIALIASDRRSRLASPQAPTALPAR
jgi:hypothetical protein